MLGLRIDAQDNIWETAVAANFVYQSDPSGRLEMVLGTKGLSGEWPYIAVSSRDEIFADTR